MDKIVKENRVKEKYISAKVWVGMLFVPTTVDPSSVLELKQAIEVGYSSEQGISYSKFGAARLCKILNHTEDYLGK